MLGSSETMRLLEISTCICLSRVGQLVSSFARALGEIQDLGSSLSDQSKNQGFLIT